MRRMNGTIKWMRVLKHAGVGVFIGTAQPFINVSETAFAALRISLGNVILNGYEIDDFRKSGNSFLLRTPLILREQ